MIFSKGEIKMICLHHVDADGYCAAYWVRKLEEDYFGTKVDPDMFIPINYGYDWDKLYNSIPNGEKVYIVDFSIEPDHMRELLNKGCDIVWIDHHKTSIEKYADTEMTSIQGIRKDGVAGCVLAWIWCNLTMHKASPDDPFYVREHCPIATQLIGDYDVWEYYFGDTTRFFKLGLDAHGLVNPVESFWDGLNNSLYNLDYHIRETPGVVYVFIDNGKIIYKYRNSLAAVATKAAFGYVFNGYKVFCCNIGDGFVNSEWLTQDPRAKDFDAVCNFAYDGKDNFWIYSFYTEKDGVDCAVIAQSLPDTISAGGHLKAAGAQVPYNIFDTEEMIRL
jgi:oligoribonuclease NrnB/cAMP/cGMP phosphodiesterase (DHH superfamily)